MKTFIIVIVVFVLAVVGLVVLSRNDSSQKSEFKLDSISPLDHVKGNASSTVVLIEYGDFQCPACRAYYSVLRELSQTYGDKMVFVYRHFPLKQIHFNAEPAAWASEAASHQSKFWEMHNLLFEKQEEWSQASDLKTVFGDYATIIGLDKEKFIADLSSKEVKNFVNNERHSGEKAGFSSTPTFVLNGKKIENPQSLDAFKILINKAIKDSVNKK